MKQICQLTFKGICKDEIINFDKSQNGTLVKAINYDYLSFSIVIFH